MISYVSIIALGFFLGMRHLTDPDHVIAIATIITRSRKVLESAAIGIVWAIGHTLTILLAGAGIILFNLVISPRAGLAVELTVGVMLIGLGLASLAGFRRWMPTTAAADPSSESDDRIIHSHFHSHGDYVNHHPHEHNPEFHPHRPDQTPLAAVARAFERLNLYRHAKPFIVVIVHGLAGSAAVALLVLTTIRNPRWAVAYLLLFGMGTIADIMLITMTMALTFRIAGAGQDGVSRKLRLVSGLVSLAFGIFIAYQVCFVHGFLSSTPQWTPR